MKLGYPCINRSIGCTANHTFRLASYSEERLKETVEKNLDCMQEILEYNLERGFMFFRISSDTVPFASHPVCRFSWRKHFSKKLGNIGRFIKKHKMRISMHPDQFVLLNSQKEEVVERSIAELDYHCELLDGMGLPASAKVQLHVGGVYGERENAMERFVERYGELSEKIKKRLAIENDHRSYPLADCMELHSETGIPVIFDSFHHECLNRGEKMRKAVETAAGTWKKRDGVPMLDYSSQKKGTVKGSHTEHIDARHFRKFLKETEGIDFDIMLEIKDKENSAKTAIKILKQLGRV
ncbi:UV DNA damage repair endonuclease UvsE [Candidatus Micrarchaeota archaeon]|nr:UV DNA damage repair endonuclease UvsE [Candidatus Micrarchaeota archaeon]MBD3418100.1 UV DNA damage repair endonuclease UvsE [Candidatus Micrarchaeota archaeon]